MKYKDMKGKRCGGLSVIKRSSLTNKKGQVFWICECTCGRFLIVRGDRLRDGTATQCSVCNGRGRPSLFIEEGDLNGTV
jgi:hypothetical protein